MLANGTGQTTDTWTYDAWGETTSRTGVTENDYLYAGERFDRTTELYQLRARYLDPKTGTFLSLDPYQGNRHDPASLHKYMYANANPVNNTDPTGLWTLGEMGGAMAGQSILAGANGLNFAAMLGLMGGRAKAIVGATIALSLLTEKFMESALNGDIKFVTLLSMLRRAILNTVTGPINATSDGEFTQEENERAVEELDKPGNTHGGHIKQEKHGWLEKFGLDPNDPNDWEKIKFIISTVLTSGTKIAYENSWRRILEITVNGVKAIVEVRYYIKDGRILSIGTAFVQ